MSRAEAILKICKVIYDSAMHSTSIHDYGWVRTKIDPVDGNLIDELRVHVSTTSSLDFAEIKNALPDYFDSKGLEVLDIGDGIFGGIMSMTIKSKD